MTAKPKYKTNTAELPRIAYIRQPACGRKTPRALFVMRIHSQEYYLCIAAQHQMFPSLAARVQFLGDTSMVDPRSKSNNVELRLVNFGEFFHSILGPSEARPRIVIF